MAVLIEAISVVVRASSIISKFPGGFDGFKQIVPNGTLCADNELARVGFMMPDDVESFVKKLERFDLVYQRNGQPIDINVVDQLRGIATPCDWLEFGHTNLQGYPEQQIAACRLTGSSVGEVVMPEGWLFENSLSHTYGFVPSEHLSKSLRYLRDENGLDVFLNLVTNEEVYVGRTGEFQEGDPDVPPFDPSVCPHITTAVSRDKARTIAEEALKNDSEFDGVSEVYAWDEITFRKPSLYLVGGDDLENCWVAYARRPEPRIWMLQSSTIVVIDKTSGRVVYQGCAGDEG